VPAPDALAAEFAARQVAFSAPLKDDDDGLRGFEVKDADGYLNPPKNTPSIALGLDGDEFGIVGALAHD
jgi:hypothetical protein